MKFSKILSGIALSVATMFSLAGISVNALDACPKQEAVNTEIIIIIDKSGSMRGKEKDTVGSFNSLIEEQKKLGLNDNAHVTTVMFNGEHTTLHDNVKLEDVQVMTEKDYTTSGCTALLDAVGDTINKISERQSNKCTCGYVKNKVLVAIITDGEENSSREYSKGKVKNLIEEKTNEGWEFLYMGANIDAVKEAGKIGIKTAINYSTDNMQDCYKTVNAAFAKFREIN